MSTGKRAIPVPCAVMSGGDHAAPKPWKCKSNAVSCASVLQLSDQILEYRTRRRNALFGRLEGGIGGPMAAREMGGRQRPPRQRLCGRVKCGALPWVVPASRN